MRQAILKKGVVIPVEIPEPQVKPGFVKIKVLYSCISSGTEMSGVIGSKKSLLKKAMEKPEKVKQAIDVFLAKGLKNTLNKISEAQSALKSLGYSVSGIVAETGDGVSGLTKGELVAAGGIGFAVHAEYVVVPKNLVTKVPEGVKPEYASLGTVGSIALHGVRRADLRLGEYAVIFGTGLLGILALQMLQASGVRVACIDISESRLKIAKYFGAEMIINPENEDSVSAIRNWTNDYGADAVLFTAATSESEPISQAFKMCRKKGRVVLVGVADTQIKREDIYKDEIDFLISTSYGPGRYDDKYELEGIDYPYHYVRWTENRNIAEFLRLVGEGHVQIDPLNPRTYSIEDVSRAYADLEEKDSDSLVSIISYSRTIHDEKKITKVYLESSEIAIKKGVINIGLIGAGGFAKNTLLPIITELKDKYALIGVANRNGQKAHAVARQFNANYATSDYEDILKDDSIDLVMICTRHGNHASLVLEALNAKKHVFVEKPLATEMGDLKLIEEFYSGNDRTKPILMVGFNRRFSLYTTEIIKATQNRQAPILIRYRMNAGYIPANHWVHEDGGRIIGEACHIVDLMAAIVQHPVTEISTTAINPEKGKYLAADNRSFTLKFKDGSIAIIDYFALGNNGLPKENLEVHFDSKTIIVDDYKTIQAFGLKMKALKSRTPLKGHYEEWLHLYDGLKTGTFPIPLESLINTTYISILAANH